VKFLDELLGFAVLTGPLWLILILLPVCIWIAIKISKRLKPGITRIAGGVGIFLLLFALPFGDEIAGRVYFNYLCATEAGVKVYQTVELPAEYWDEHGKATFIDEKAGGFLLGKEYPPEYKTGAYSTFFHIDNAGYKRVDKQSGRVFGEVTDFRYWGGWMRRNLSPSNTATRCEGGIERSNSLIKQIFRPKKS
jgi:hypothetical protein